jgi:hypothetical protein
MARVFTILKALGRDLYRDQKSLGSVTGNNFFPISAYLLRTAGAFVYLLIGLVLLFPLSTDPLRRIPASRLSLWPLESRERWALRALSPWVNPISWLIVAVAIWAARGAVTAGLWAFLTGLVAVAVLVSNLSLPRGRSLWLYVPGIPGPWRQLVRKNIREMLATLDFYCALLLCLSACLFRLFGGVLPPEGLLAMAVLILLALSSYAQCLFGLDGVHGLARYRLLPLHGWEALAAKDAAFLLLAIPLILPFAPLPGLAAALIALAAGHKPTVQRHRPQVRWRFSSGAPLFFGVYQVGLMVGAAAGVFFRGPFVLLACLLIWAWSLGYYGRQWDRALLS